MAKEAKPYFPAPYEKADVKAFKNLQAGEATPEQQKRALNFIINTLCGTYDLSFRPGGEEGSRESDFAEGSRFVGLQIVKLLNLNLNTLTDKEDKA